MNKVFLIGNLTRDPELSTTNNGINYCRFTLAVPRRFFTSRTGERDADFINIVVWRTQAENCHKYLRKGSKACVVGYIQTRTYDASDGTKRYTTEVVADEVEFLSNRSSMGDQSGSTGNYSSSSGSGKYAKPASKESTSGTAELQPVDDDSLPF